MNNPNKKPLKVILISCAILIGLLIVVIIIAGSTIGEGIIKGIVEKNLSKMLHMNVTIEDLFTNIFSVVEVVNLDVFDPSSGMSSFHVKDLKVHYNILALLSNRLSLSEITVNDMRVYVMRDVKGKLLIPELPSTEEPSKNSMVLNIDKVNVTNSSFSYDDKSIPFYALLQEFSLLVQHQGADESYDFETGFKQADITYDEKDLKVKNFNISGTFTQQELTVSNAGFSLFGIDVTASAEVENIEKSPYINGEIFIDGDPYELIDIFDDDLPVRYRPDMNEISARITYAGTLDDYNIATSLNIPSIVAEEIELTGNNLSMHLTNDTLHIDTLSTHVFDGTFVAKGFVELDSLQRFSIQSSLSDINIVPLWDFIYTTPSSYTGNLHGTLAVESSLQSIVEPSLSVQINSTNFSFKNKTIPELHTSFSYCKGDGEFLLTQGTSKISAQFSLDDSMVSGQAIIAIQEIEYLAGLFDVQGLTGQLIADCDFSGSLNNPSVTAQLQGKKILYQGLPIDSLQTRISYEDSTLNILSSNISGKTNSIKDFTRAMLETELEGSCNYNITLKGTLNDFTGSVIIKAADVLYENRKIDHLSIRGTAENKHIELEELSLKIEDIICKGSGSFNMLQKDGNVVLQFEKLTGLDRKSMGKISTEFTLEPSIALEAELDKVDLMLAQVAADSLPNINGFLSGVLHFSGTLDKPNGTLDLKIEKPSYEDIIFDNVELSADITPSNIILKQAIVELYQSRLRARGKVGLEHSENGTTISDKSSIKGELTLDDIEAANFTELFPNNITLKGSLSAHASVDGFLARPVVQGVIAIQDGFLQTGEKKPPLTGLNAKVIFDQDSLDIKEFTCDFTQKKIALTGYILQENFEAFSADLALDVGKFEILRIKGRLDDVSVNGEIKVDDFDLSFLAALLPQIDYSKGFVDASLIIKGKTTSPSIQGFINGKNLEFQPKGLPVPFTKGGVDIVFDAGSFDINSLNFAFGEGIISCNGFAKYSQSGVQDLHINLQAKDVYFNQKKVLQFTLKDAMVQYYKTGSGFILDGSIKLGETKYQQNVQIPEVLESLGRPKIFHKPTPLMTQTKLNIQITNSDDILLDNNIAHINMKLALNIIGTLANPNLGGRIDLTDGYIIYLDRKFELTRGVLDFIDPNQINPTLDVQAIAKVKNYNQPENPTYLITITVTGPADKAKINLQSVPALDQANILSILTFGTTREQIFSQCPDNYQTSLKDILLERAKLYSSQKIASYVAGRLTHLLGLDDVSIEGNIFDLDDGGPQLTASKKLSDRIKVTYSTKVGYLNEQSIKLDYKLTDHFYLQGQADQEGTAGIDAIYRIHFK
ncbi:MAG TPA: hypothetical protein ENG70_05605 [Candidatus Cloacimonetes bacterium]|nr:hypothetical protein [Candidatus Cloacimonadota bacterium]HEX38309.1 hypothetical protein [Candidatus Cloacimonadota bacterium]